MSSVPSPVVGIGFNVFTIIFPLWWWEKNYTRVCKIWRRLFKVFIFTVTEKSGLFVNKIIRWVDDRQYWHLVFNRHPECSFLEGLQSVSQYILVSRSFREDEEFRLPRAFVLCLDVRYIGLFHIIVQYFIKFVMVLKLFYTRRSDIYDSDSLTLVLEKFNKMLYLPILRWKWINIESYYDM